MSGVGGGCEERWGVDVWHAVQAWHGVLMTPKYLCGALMTRRHLYSRCAHRERPILIRAVNRRDEELTSRQMHFMDLKAKVGGGRGDAAAGIEEVEDARWGVLEHRKAAVVVCGARDARARDGESTRVLRAESWGVQSLREVAVPSLREV